MGTIIDSRVAQPGLSPGILSLLQAEPCPAKSNGSGEAQSEAQRPKQPEKPATNDSKTTGGKRTYQFTDLSAIIEKPVEWIEEPFLARGEMHFLQGQGGSYKGTMALTWVAEATRRGEHTLLILAEDDLAKKVKPALIAAGADINLVHPVLMGSGEEAGSIVLPYDTDQLEQAINATRATLVVIDPLLSHVAGDHDSYRDHDMKRVLTKSVEWHSAPTQRSSAFTTPRKIPLAD